MNRRQIMTSLPGLAALAATHASAAGFAAPDKPPMLPIFNPRQMGATGDGKTLDTAAINAAINACTQAGGGVVYLSPGTYLCGTVILKSNVTLYLEAGATIMGSTNIKDYPTRHLIFCDKGENITIAGPGRIFGQGEKFWVKSNRAPVTEDKLWADAVHNDYKNLDRPSPLVELRNIVNLRVESIRIEEAPGWTMRAFNCDNVVIHGIAIKNPVYGVNTDGIDPTGCHNVLISDCIIDTGDDCICLKGEDPDGLVCRTTKNLVVTNCILSGCCNGFKIGTPTLTGFENITFSNSVLFNEDVPFGSRLNAGISLEMVDGGYLDGIVISNIQMRRVRSPLNIRLGHRKDGNRQEKQKGVRGILIEGIHATDAILTSSITGIPGMELEDIRLSHIDIETVYPGKKEWVKHPVPEVENAYPQSRMFGWLPSSGFYFRHIKGLSLQNINFTAPKDEWRPTIIFDSVAGLRFDGFTTTPIVGGPPAIALADVENAWVSAASAPSGSKALLTVSGAKSTGILVSGCDVREAATLAQVGDGATAAAIQAEFNVGKAKK